MKEAAVPAETLCELLKAAFAQWMDAGLDVSEVFMPVEVFRRYLSNKIVFVAHDAATGDLLAMHTFRLDKRKGIATGANLAVSPAAKHEGIATRMLQKEAELFSKAGFRYLCENTAIPATWSVNWHKKNGYYITGYKRSDKKNYASYTFRKPIASDLRHHPLDLLWTSPIAPVTARLSFIASYIITCLIKTRTGQLTPLGRLAIRLFRKKT
jgi:GNAT superfamily N-acetyltransferase